MPDRYAPPKEFEQVTAVFEDFCKRNELRPLAQAVEKHGSWEWAAVAQGEIDRFVSLALTELSEPLEAPRIYSVEVWAEAEATNERRVGWRSLVTTFRANEPGISQGKFSARVTAGLQQALERARLIDQQSLTEVLG